MKKIAFDVVATADTFQQEFAFVLERVGLRLTKCDDSHKKHF